MQISIYAQSYFVYGNIYLDNYGVLTLKPEDEHRDT